MSWACNIKQAKSPSTFDELVVSENHACVLNVQQLKKQNCTLFLRVVLPVVVTRQGVVDSGGVAVLKCRAGSSLLVGCWDGALNFLCSIFLF